MAMTAPDFTGELTDLEERASLASLEGLHAERRQLIEANAKLVALHGSFGLFDNFRKKMLECEKVRMRMELSAKGVKTTETMIDAEAHASEAYARFLDTALEEKIAWLTVSTRLSEIEESIRNREMSMTAYSREISLR